MAKTTYAWMRDKRLPLINQRMREAGMLQEDEALEIDQTGGTKYPYQLVISYANGEHRAQTRMGVAGTLASVDLAADVLHDLAWRLISAKVDA